MSQVKYIGIKKVKNRITFSKLCCETLYDKNLGAVIIDPDEEKIL